MQAFKSLFVAAMVLVSSHTFAKKFSNGYIEFELPPKWQCVIEGSEWVCQSENADRKKEAIAAKLLLLLYLLFVSYNSL